MNELIDRRVLGAISFVDTVTRKRVTTGLELKHDPLVLKPQASGLYVVHSAPGFEATTRSFDAPAAPLSTKNIVAMLITAPTSAVYTLKNLNDGRKFGALLILRSRHVIIAISSCRRYAVIFDLGGKRIINKELCTAE